MYASSSRISSRLYKAPLRILVEGNIGSGKTTLLNKIKSNNNISTLYEPLNRWMNLNGFNGLAELAKDKNKNGTLFQILVQTSFQEMYNENNLNEICIYERSIYSSRYVFGQSLRDNGMINDFHFEILDYHFKTMLKLIPFKFNAMIYLKASPETCFQRIKERNRSGEETLSLDYLESLDECHDDWIIKKKFPNRKLPTHNIKIIDAEQSFDVILKEVLDFVYCLKKENDEIENNVTN